MTAVEPTYDATAVIRTVLIELAKRDILPTFGPATIAKATEAAGRLLRALGADDEDNVVIFPYWRRS